MSLQAQIDELAGAGGGHIDLPPGNIELPDDGLALHPFVSLRGAGRSTRLVYGGAGIAVRKYIAASDPMSLWRLSGFVVEAPHAECGIELAGDHGNGMFSIEAVGVLGGGGDGWRISDVCSSRMAQCFADGGWRDGFSIGRNAIMLTLDQCWSRAFRRFGVKIAGEATGACSGVRLRECIVDSPVVDDDQGSWWGTGCYTEYAHGTVLDGCHFEGVARGAFVGGAPSTGSHVRGCRFQGTSRPMVAIEVHSASRSAVVSKNTIMLLAEHVSSGLSHYVVDRGQQTEVYQ